MVEAYGADPGGPRGPTGLPVASAGRDPLDGVDGCREVLCQDVPGLAVGRDESGVEGVPAKAAAQAFSVAARSPGAMATRWVSRPSGTSP